MARTDAIFIAKLICLNSSQNTRPHATLHLSSIDQTLFSAGQAYVALSRCPKWKHVQIISLHRDAFKTDPEVTKEYQ